MLFKIKNSKCGVLKWSFQDKFLVFFFFPEDKAFILWMYLMMVELNDEVIKEKT